MLSWKNGVYDRMILNIKLDNPKYCEGCPCNIDDSEAGPFCGADYWFQDD